MKFTRDQFLSYESFSTDSIDVKRAYIDMADGDIVAGVLLSQIIYWHLCDRNGKERLRVAKDGEKWIAKSREEWWDECRLSAKQFDRCAALLEEKGLIMTRVYHWQGAPVKHTRLNWDVFLAKMDAILSQKPATESGPPPQSQQPETADSTADSPRTTNRVNSPKGNLQNGVNYPKGNMDIAQTGSYILTENTTENSPPSEGAAGNANYPNGDSVGNQAALPGITENPESGGLNPGAAQLNARSVKGGKQAAVKLDPAAVIATSNNAGEIFKAIMDNPGAGITYDLSTKSYANLARWMKTCGREKYIAGIHAFITDSFAIKNNHRVSLFESQGPDGFIPSAHLPQTRSGLPQWSPPNPEENWEDDPDIPAAYVERWKEKQAAKKAAEAQSNESQSNETKESNDHDS